jgi:hypothetical protein
MSRLYHLKLHDKTIKYLNKIKREYGVKVSVGKIQDFNINEFFDFDGEPLKANEAAGYYFTTRDGVEHIYVANKQVYKKGHDAIVLHEIGHLLLNRHRYLKYKSQEESFANGFALAKAQELGIYIDPDMVIEMCNYSDNYYKKTIKKVKRK